MGTIDKMQSALEKFIGPVAAVLTNNHVMKSVTRAFMGTMCLSVGMAVYSILINLPITPWQDFLASLGISAIITGAINVTINMLAVYVVLSVAYNYTKETDENPLTAMVLSLAAFFILMPLDTIGEGMSKVRVLQTAYMGSKGFLVALLVGVSVSALYCFLCKKNLKLKLPDSVPPMVSNAFSPVIISGILFGILIVVKALFTLLPGGNIYDFIANTVAAPLISLAATPLSLIIYYTFTNFLWFLGIHPSALNGIWLPIFFSVNTMNIEAFMNGQPLPCLIFSVLTVCVYIGGQGNTLSLSMLTLFAKSERYKSMRKLVIIPNLFNINEPAVFGFPIMMNPYYFIPMVFSSMVSGFLGWGLALLIQPSFNPTVSLAWTMPAFILGLAHGGLKLLFIVVCCFLSQVALYYPFFRMADNKALEEERAMAAEMEASKQ